jgi:hypothetical protein
MNHTLPAEEWLTALQVFNCLAAVDAPDLDALEAQHDIVVEHLRTGRLRSYVTPTRGTGDVTLPSHVFTRGLTIGVVHGKIDKPHLRWPNNIGYSAPWPLPPTLEQAAWLAEYQRLAAAEASSDAAWGELKAAGLTAGEVRFLRADIVAVFDSQPVVEAGQPSAELPAGVDGQFVTADFKDHHTVVLKFAEWLKWKWPDGNATPKRTQILSTHRIYFGQIKGISDRTIQEPISLAWPNRVGGSPSHHQDRQDAA